MNATSEHDDRPTQPSPQPRRGRRVYYIAWLVLKNIIGWAMILASGPIGLALPGPGGLPLFIIGFAMITFPGKRALTSRVLRGRPWRINARQVVVAEVLGSIVLPALAVWVLSIRFREQMNLHGPKVVWTAYALAVVVSFLVVRVAVRGVNWAVTFVPIVRRRVRPWMRHHGIDLLPPRRRKRLQHSADPNVNSSRADADQDVDTGILELDPKFHAGLRSAWSRVKPWIFVAAAVTATFTVAYLIVTRT